MFRSARVVGGLRDLELEKSALKISHRPVSGRREQTVLLGKKLVEENPQTTIRERCEKRDVSIGSAERIMCNDFNWRKKKCCKLYTPSTNRPAKETAS